VAAELDYVVNLKFVNNLAQLAQDFEKFAQKTGSGAAKSGSFGAATTATAQRAREIAGAQGLSAAELNKVLNRVLSQARQQARQAQDPSGYRKGMREGGYDPSVVKPDSKAESAALKAEMAERAKKVKASALETAQLQEMLAGDSIYTQIQKRIAVAKRQQLADLQTELAKSAEYGETTKQLAIARKRMAARDQEALNRSPEYRQESKREKLASTEGKIQEAEDALDPELRAATKRLATTRQKKAAVEQEDLATSTEYQAATRQLAISRRKKAAREQEELNKSPEYQEQALRGKKAKKGGELQEAEQALDPELLAVTKRLTVLRQKKAAQEAQDIAGSEQYRTATKALTRARAQKAAQEAQDKAGDQEYVKAKAAETRAHEEMAAKIAIEAAGYSSKGLGRSDLLANAAVLKRTQADLQAAAAARAMALGDEKALKAAVDKTMEEQKVTAILRQRERAEIRARIKANQVGDVTGFQKLQGYMKGTAPAGEQTGPQMVAQKTITSASYMVGGAISGAAIFGTIQAVQEASKLQEMFAGLRGQMDSLGQSGAFNSVRDGIKNISTETGIAASEVTKFASRLLGVFNDPARAVKETEAAMKLAVVSGTDLATMLEELVPIADLFGVSIEHIGDLAVSIQDKFGIAGEATLHFLGEVAPLAEEAGLSLEEMGVLGATAANTTGKSIKVAAEQFTKVLPTMQANQDKIFQILRSNPETAARVPDIVEAFGRGESGKALKEILGAYNQLDGVQQANLIRVSGSRREWALLNGLFSNSGKLLDDMRAAEEGVGATTGSLDRRFTQVSATISRSLERIQEGFKNMVEGFLSSGLGDSLVVIGKSLEMVVGLVNALVGAFMKLNEITSHIPGLNESGLLIPLVQFTAAAFAASKAVKLFNLARAGGAQGSIVLQRGEDGLSLAIQRRTQVTAQGEASLASDTAMKEADAAATGQLAAAEGAVATTRGAGAAAAGTGVAGAAAGGAGIRQMASGRYQDITTGKIISNAAAEQRLAAAAGAAPAAAGVREMASGRYQNLATGKIMPTAAAKEYLAGLPAPPVAGVAGVAGATAASATAAEAAAAASSTASTAAGTAAQAASTASSAASTAAAGAAEAAAGASTAASGAAASASEGAAAASGAASTASGAAGAAGGAANVAGAASGWAGKLQDSKTMQRLFSGGRLFQGTSLMQGMNTAGAAAGTTAGVGPFMGIALPVIAGVMVKGKYDEQKGELEEKGQSYREQLKKTTEEDLERLSGTYDDWYSHFQEDFFKEDLGGTLAKKEQQRRKGARGAASIGVLTDRKWVDRFAKDITDERLADINNVLNQNTEMRKYAAEELGANMEGNIAEKGLGLASKATKFVGRQDLPFGLGQGTANVTRENLKELLPKIQERADKGEEGAAQLAYQIEQEIAANRNFADVRKAVDEAVAKGDVNKAIEEAGGIDAYLQMAGLYDPEGMLQTGQIGEGQYISIIEQKVIDLRNQLKGAPDQEKAQKELDQAMLRAQQMRDKVNQERIDGFKRVAEITSFTPKQATMTEEIKRLSGASMPAQLAKIPELIQGRWEAFQEELSHIQDPVELYRRESEGVKIDPETQALQLIRNIKQSPIAGIADKLKGNKSQDEFFRELANKRRETGQSLKEIVYDVGRGQYQPVGGDPASKEWDDFQKALAGMTEQQLADLDQYVSVLKTPQQIIDKAAAEREATIATAAANLTQAQGGTSPMAGAQGEVAKANIELAKFLKLQELGVGGPTIEADIANAQANVARAYQGVAAVEHQTAASMDQWAVVFAGRDPVKRTNAELTAAINQSNRILQENMGDVKDPKYIDSLQRQETLRQQQVDNRNAITRAQMELGAFDRNQDPEAAARDARALAEFQLKTAQGDEERIRALIAIKEADRQALEASRDRARANRELMAFDSNRDPVAVAQRAIEEANIAIAEAQGKGGAELDRAFLKLKEAQRTMDDANEEILKANAEFAITMANIRQDPVEAAKLAVREAERQLALARSRNAGTAEIQRLTGDLNQKRSDAIDAAVGENTSMIDFLLEMGQITTSQAIERLKVERDKYEYMSTKWRDLQSKIHSLQKGAEADAQFNLPANITMPTLYEARRLNQSRQMGVGYMDNRSIAVTFNVDGAQDPAAVSNQIMHALQGAMGGGQVYTPGVAVGAFN
jgi:hypothetical protein